MVATAERSFGYLLRRYRLAALLTQEQLAERAHLSYRTISDLERGAKHSPRRDTVLLLADGLELSPEERAALISAAHAADQQLEARELPPDDRATSGSTSPTPARHPTNLPDEPTPFIGREQEIAAIIELLQRPTVRLVTLTGAGGSGKTRLALQVGARLLEEFPAGVFFVSLASIADPTLIPSMIGTTLGVKEAGTQPLLVLLAEHLQEKHLLLVLDNFEHLLAAVEVVATLLERCPQLKVLVTSRAVLHLSREHAFEVLPLTVPDPKELPELARLSQYEAVALFIERAQAARAGFRISNENGPAVAEICYRLGGLPLAIELAAARIRMFPPRALLGRRGDWLGLLTGGARDREARQQTLRGAIDWSYDLLDEGERKLFARLSVFAGGCTLEAAEAVCNREGDLGSGILDGIASLIEQSLLREEGEGMPRFLMLETIREYATERLEECEDADQIRESHAAYYLKMAEEGEPQLRSKDQTLWLAWFGTEHANLRAALAWSLGHGKPQSTLRGAIDVSSFCVTHGYLSEARHWVETALTTGDVDPRTRAEALRALAGVAMFAGDHQRSTHLMEERLHLAQELGDIRGVAHALWILAMLAGSRGSMVQGEELFKESLRLYREVEYKRGVALVLQNFGGHLLDMGRYDEAEPAIQESLAMYRDMGDGFQTALALVTLCALERERGQYGRAREHCEEALGISRSAQYSWGTVNALEELAHLAWTQGDYGGAIVQAEEALKLFRESELSRTALTGGVDGFRYIQGIALRELGDQLRATTTLRESLRSFRKRGLKPWIVSCLEGLAGIYSRVGQAERAVRLFGVAARVREDTTIPLPASKRPCHEQHMAATRAELGDEAWQLAWEQGQTMSLEEASTYALEDDARVTSTELASSTEW